MAFRSRETAEEENCPTSGDVSSGRKMYKTRKTDFLKWEKGCRLPVGVGVGKEPGNKTEQRESFCSYTIFFMVYTHTEILFEIADVL